MVLLREKTERFYRYIGGTIPKEAAWSIKALLSVSTVNFVYHFYTTFYSKIPNLEKAKSIELTSLKKAPAPVCVNNGEREHMVFFRMLSNGYNYIAFANHAFKSFVCDLIGNVNDCLILFNPNLDQVRGLFKNLSLFVCVCDSLRDKVRLEVQEQVDELQKY